MPESTTPDRLTSTPGFASTTATGTSPQKESEAATTATCRTASCWWSAVSTSIDEIFSPPLVLATIDGRRNLSVCLASFRRCWKKRAKHCVLVLFINPARHAFLSKSVDSSVSCPHNTVSACYLKIVSWRARSGLNAVAFPTNILRRPRGSFST